MSVTQKTYHPPTWHQREQKRLLERQIRRLRHAWNAEDGNLQVSNAQVTKIMQELLEFHRRIEREEDKQHNELQLQKAKITLDGLQVRIARQKQNIEQIIGLIKVKEFELKTLEVFAKEKRAKEIHALNVRKAHREEELARREDARKDEELEIKRRKERRDQEIHEKTMRHMALMQEQARRENSDDNKAGKIYFDRLANRTDRHAAGVSSKPGLYVGMDKGEKQYYSGEGSILCYGPAGTGKYVTLLSKNLALVKNRLLICTDPKGELAYGSYNIRRMIDGEESILLNPYMLHGLGSHQFNLYWPVIRAALDGKHPSSEANLTMKSLFPHIAEGDNSWVQKGAKSLGYLYLCFSALIMPEDCNPGGMLEFCGWETDQLIEFFEEIAGVTHQEDHESDDAFAARQAQTIEERKAIFGSFMMGEARGFLERLRHTDGGENEGGGVLYMRKALAEELAIFADTDPLFEHTRGNSFDPDSLRSSPRTVFVILPKKELGGAQAKWFSMVMDVLIRITAEQHDGVRCTFMLDELSTMPVIPSLIKAINLDRSSGPQFYMFAHNPSALAFDGVGQRYGEKGVQAIEDSVAIEQMWDVSDARLIAKVSKLAGTVTITQNTNSTNFGSQSQGGSEGQSKTQRPVFPESAVAAIGHGQQILITKSDPRVSILQRKPYFETEGIKDLLRDTRGIG